MKDGIKEIIGKRIAGVIVKEADRQPKSQVFLLFDDNTHYELYCSHEEIYGAGGIDKGGPSAIRRLGEDSHRIVLEFYDGGKEA